jgi:hypothetical protein
MSATLDKLFEKYHAAWLAVAQQAAGDRKTAGCAGIRAVVAALQDELWTRIGCVEANDIINEILASDGVEAAGASARKDEGESVSEDAHKAASPVADLDACEWVRISEMGHLTHYLTPHGVTNDFYRWHPYNECSFCGKQIKLKGGK